MSLTVGELVAFLEVDKRGWSKGLNDAKSDMSSLQALSSRSLMSVEQEAKHRLNNVHTEIGKAFDPTEAVTDLDRIQAALGEALDPSRALSDVDRLVSGFGSGMDRMKTEAGRGGRGVVEQLDRALDDAERAARRSGEDAGQAFGQEVEGAGKSRMGGVGEKLIGSLKGAGWVAAGAAIGAALMKGLESAMDAQDAKAKLFAQVGATEPEMKRLGGAAGKVWADAYGENMSDVTDAIKAVVQNVDGMRDASEESLKSMAERAMDTATIMDSDVGGVTRAVSQLMRTNLVGSADEAFDVIVRGAQLGADKSEDLLDSLNEYSTQFRSLGLDAKTTLGLVQQGLKAGARDTDVVVDTLKEFAIEAVKGGDNVRKGFKDLGLDADAMVAKFSKGGPTAAKAFDTVLDKLRGIEDPAKRNATAVELFGTKAEDMAGALYALDPSSAMKALGDVGGAAKNAGDQLHDTASNKVEQFKRGLEQGVVNFIGDNVLPALDSLADHVDLSGLSEKAGPALDELRGLVSDVFGDIGQWVDENGDKLDEWSDKIGGAFDDAEAILSDVREFWDEWGGTITDTAGATVDGIVSTFSGGWKLVKGVWDTALGFITGDWSKFKSGILSIGSGLWDTLNSLTFGALNRFKEGISSSVSAAGKYFSGLKDKVVAALKGAGSWLVSTGKNLVQGLINGVKAMAGKAAESAKSVVQGAINGAKNLLGIKSPSKVFTEIGKFTVMGFVQGVLQEQPRAQMTAKKFAALMKEALSAKLDRDAPDNLVEWVKKNTGELSTLADKREALIKRIADAKAYAAQIASSAADFASLTNIDLGDDAGVDTLVTGLANKLAAVKKFDADIKKLIKMGLNKTTLRQIIEAGPDKGLSIAEMLLSGGKDDVKAINRIQKQLDKTTKQLGKTAADGLYDQGKLAGQGFLKGLQGQLKELESMMAKIAKAVVDAVKKELKVKSPSRVFMDIGDNTMLGFIQGIAGREASTIDAVRGVVGKSISAAASMPPAMAQMAARQAARTSTAGGGGGGGLIAGHGPAAGNGGVTVLMPGATIREEADLYKLGTQFAFEYRSRG